MNVYFGFWFGFSIWIGLNLSFSSLCLFLFDLYIIQLESNNLINLCYCGIRFGQNNPLSKLLDFVKFYEYYMD